MLNKHKIQGTPSGMTHPIVNIKPTGIMWANEDWFYVNPLGIRTDRMSL